MTLPIPLMAAATSFPLTAPARRSRIGPVLHTSPVTSPTPVDKTTPLAQSLAQPLSAGHARVSLRSTPLVSTAAVATPPASADTQAVDLVLATVTAPQVTQYAAASAAPPPADSPQSSLDPFPSGSATVPKSRAHRLSSGTNTPAPQHHNRAERLRSRPQMEMALKATSRVPSLVPSLPSVTSSTSITLAAAPVLGPNPIIGVRGCASYHMAPAEERHASTSNLSKHNPAVKASRTAEPPTPADCQAIGASCPAALPRSHNRSPFVYRLVVGLDPSAQFQNQETPAAINTVRHERYQLEVHLTPSPVPVDMIDLGGTEGNDG